MFYSARVPVAGLRSFFALRYLFFSGIVSEHLKKQTYDLNREIEDPEEISAKIHKDLSLWPFLRP